MENSCIECGMSGQAVGLLCRRCVEVLPPCEGLLPEHVVSMRDPEKAQGWLIDGWGNAHPLAGTTRVGRRPNTDLILLNSSVSREHAVLTPSPRGWRVRDLGSRNGTHIDGQEIEGKVRLVDGARLRFGEVWLLFRDGGLEIPGSFAEASVETAQAGAAVRYGIASEQVELVLLSNGGLPEAGSGGLLYRLAGAGDWQEIALPPLEFRLLEALCVQAVTDAEIQARLTGFVSTRQLARVLPFQSRYADENNVRQVVKRIRRKLDKIGVSGLVDSVPGHGYFVAWPVSRS